MTDPHDPSHSYQSLLQEYDNGKMDGFDLNPVNLTVAGGTGPTPANYVYGDVPRSETTIVSDIQNGVLPQIAWLTPPSMTSDHAGDGTAYGPDWVAHVVEAIENSKQCAGNTAIVVTHLTFYGRCFRTWLHACRRL